jgi:hypothetical protein
MEPLLRIIKINGLDDLPTEEGHYWTFQGDIHCLTSEPYNKEANDHWLANVEWYLAPQEQEDKRLIYHLNCEKCGDLFWSNEAFPKSQYCYKCEQEQQEKKTSWRDFTMTDKVDEPPKETSSFYVCTIEGNQTKIYKNGVLIEPNYRCGIPLTMEQCKQLTEIKNEYQTFPKEVKSALDILKNELSPAVYGGLIHTFNINRIKKAMEEYASQFQTEQKTMTDEEIEEWARNKYDKISTKDSSSPYYGTIGDVRMFRDIALIDGAKAMRDGLIKTKQ